MSNNVTEEIRHNADELLKGLAEKIITGKELLFTPDNIKKINIYKPDLHRIISEILYGSGQAGNADLDFSLHFANARRRIAWIGKSKKTKAAVIKNSFSGHINTAAAQKVLHNTKKESFSLLSIKQAEEKIICLINNYLTAL